jgi:hypothetical protein
MEKTFLPSLNTGTTPDQIKTERDASIYIRKVAQELRQAQAQKAGGGGTT